MLMLLMALLFLGCPDDDEPMAVQTVDLTVDFRAEYGDLPLAIQAGTYDYPGGARLKVLKFQYYLSDISLLPADRPNATEMLSEIELIRYDEAGDGATQQRTFRVPPGEYRALRFGLGVKPELNARPPSDFAADFALNESEYWSPAADYVFAKIEANAELEGDNRFDTGLSYHLGGDELYTTIEIPVSLSIDGSGDPGLTLVADLRSVFTGGGEAFDIRDPQRRAVHGGNQSTGATLWTNLSEQLSLEVR